MRVGLRTISGLPSDYDTYEVVESSEHFYIVRTKSPGYGSGVEAIPKDVCEIVPDQLPLWKDVTAQCTFSGARISHRVGTHMVAVEDTCGYRLRMVTLSGVQAFIVEQKDPPQIVVDRESIFPGKVWR